jgi:hypothetical protein
MVTAEPAPIAAGPNQGPPTSPELSAPGAGGFDNRIFLEYVGKAR